VARGQHPVTDSYGRVIEQLPTTVNRLTADVNRP